MNGNFTITIDREKITCRAGKEDIHLNYHGTLVGWVYWVFNRADWVQVNGRMLYINRHSLVTTIFKLSEATRRVWEDRSQTADATDAQFYERVFAKVREVRENGAVVKIDYLNDWIDVQIRTVAAEKLAEKLPLYLHSFKEDFNRYFLEELLRPQPTPLKVLEDAIQVLKFFDYSNNVSATRKFFDDPAFAPVRDSDEVKKMKCRFAAIFIEEAKYPLIQQKPQFGVTEMKLSGLVSKQKAFGEEARLMFLQLLTGKSLAF